MTGPIAPDALRDEVARPLAHKLSGPKHPNVFTVADAVLAVVAKHQGAEVERLRAHSIFANHHISWRIAVAVGDVPEGVDRIEGDPDEQLDRLIAQRNAAQDRIARALAVLGDLPQGPRPKGDPWQTGYWTAEGDIAGALRTVLGASDA